MDKVQEIKRRRPPVQQSIGQNEIQIFSKTRLTLLVCNVINSMAEDLVLQGQNEIQIFSKTR